MMVRCDNSTADVRDADQVKKTKTWPQFSFSPYNNQRNFEDEADLPKLIYCHSLVSL